MKDKVVIVTGASSGIGLAIAEHFAKKGCKVVFAARSFDKLQEITENLNLQGCDTFPVKTNVTIEDSCKNLIDKTIEKYGKIDVLINNAGISMRAVFNECELKVLHELMDVNFWGTVNCTKFALPYIIETKGAIVGIISIAGYQPLPGRTGYSASKFAVRGFLDTIRIENKNNDVNVLVVAPGYVATDIRFRALLADGSQQGYSPRDEKKMQSTQWVAKRIYNAVKHKRRSIIMTTLGFVTVFVRNLWPKFTDRESYKIMNREQNSPLIKKN
ncbi:MAG: SDR family oxidoreductase [Bacteroidales bacterium]|jgi:short-subunit dehydrogenase|nr:SDR family oxidoreductase [Bacteroidales bacterium]